ncbi:MAG: glutamate decarboxylase [Deltaproteobacteria bacterium]|nr:glutamate decarboxylase [Deltaproteobacteria bacterium]MBV8453814.1 glutamate decarboxylase [Deltaproteobacteria bacterium]
MSLHRKHDLGRKASNVVHTSGDLLQPVPKYKIPPDEGSERNAYSIIHDELLLDGNARQNLATFCTTRMEPEVQTLMAECIDKNMCDKDEYPQTAEIESRCVHILADLWNSPAASNAIGCSTTGSSEAAMLGGLAAKWRWRARRRAQGKPADKPNLVCGPVQVCWHKFGRYFDVEVREVPVEGDRFLMGSEQALARCDENTIMVVATLGVTMCCQYEPVQAIAQALDKLQADTGLDIPIHVDAASGGFLAPFCDPDLIWDFRLPRVKSINTSGHKFGLAPLGVGWIIWRDHADLPEELVFHVNYLGGEMPTFALNFSRPAGQVVCQYYNFLRLGFEGYRKFQNACYHTAQHLAAEIGKLEPFRIIHGGSGGLPAVCWTLREGIENGFTLYDLSDRLRTRGWQVPAYSMPPNREDLVVQRIVIRHGVSRDLMDLLLEDIQRSLVLLEKHPVSYHLTETEAGGYNHN